MILRPAPCLLSLALACAAPLVAQGQAAPVAERSEPSEPSEPSGPAAARPKIGLALSGGGAKGCAHIGVLRVLQELRVPVDYIAGTSMGAIIGGLYASGLSPDELEKAIIEIDWADALVDATTRTQLQFRRKDDDLHYVPEVEIGLGRDGFRYPLGLRSGQKLNYHLNRLTLPVRSVHDFDDLAIPFRAVATDITTGRPVVLGSGELARALRASMAIPTAFSPVEIDGKLLVDGGVSDNIPVDVVRAMGADIVIAIDIGSPLLANKEVRRSFLSILDQTLGLITRGNMAAQLEGADLVLSPAVSGFGTLEFSRSAEIVTLGEEEARLRAAELSHFSVDEEAYATWRDALRRDPDPVPVIREIRIEGNQRVDTRIIRPLVQARPGSDFSPEAARDDLGRIFGLGDFEAVDLVLEDFPDGSAALIYRVREKPWGPMYLRAGLNFEAIPTMSSNSLTALVGIRASRLNALGAEWATQLQLGEESGFRTEFYQPLEFDAGWFVAPSVLYNSGRLPIFDGEDRIAEIDVHAEAIRADLGHVFGQYGELRLGVERSWSNIDQRTGTVPEHIAVYLDETIDRGALVLTGTVDRLDDAKLPKHGWLIQLNGSQSFDSLGNEGGEYYRAELRADRFWTRGRNTLFGAISGGVSGDEPLPPYDRFLLGGLFSFTGFEYGELSGDNYGLARAGYLYQLTKSFHVGGMLEVARVEDRRLPGDTSDETLEREVSAATALVVVDSPAGPLYLAFGGSPEGRTSAYIVFGRRF